MRPIGVTAIALLTWLRGALYALAGLAIMGIGHLGARLIAAAASDTFIERLASGLGKALGIGALAIAAVYIVVGLGLWGLKSWARTVTVVFAGIWLVLGLFRIVPHPSLVHGIRSATDLVIIAYLSLPDVKSAFAQ
jgi:uncharacterized membrane protein